jgi:hypothetical protein
MEECLLWVELWSRYAASYSACSGASALPWCHDKLSRLPVKQVDKTCSMLASAGSATLSCN